ncbi:cysteine permease [Campylobacter mucosalis]|uniref:cysteine permease n=1 Tax=Campylobacter mucosalis TaxID=202 RepID=UPI001470076E|nr:cysteine permease [Campylobacter mucosalis]
MKLILAPNEFLDEYILACEFYNIAGISSNAYLFWKNAISAKFENSRVVFLYKKSIPKKYENILPNCSDLNGLVLSSTFCSFCGLASSHLTRSNGSKFYELVQIKEICGIKFVNLKKFYDDFGLDYNLRIYIEKCKFFSPTPFEKRIRLTDTLCLGYY